jgi:hypothetical protein
MLTFEYDLRYLQAGSEQLESYLLANELYWPVGTSAPHGQPPYPQLTPGGLLLARRRGRATAITLAQQVELSRVEQKLEATFHRWRTAWRQKAHTDWLARLKLWANFLDEYREKPSANFDRFPYEVGRRAQIELLQPEAEPFSEAEMRALPGLDAMLRAFFLPGSFVWQSDLQAQFPPQPFWYLYGSLRQETG